MRQCGYCGTEHSDEATQCRICHKPLVVPNEISSPVAHHVMSPEEKKFWERMTFREFAVLFIRLQAVWLFFYALIDITYLVPYLSRFLETSSNYGVPADVKRSLLLSLLRIALHIVAGVLAIQKAEPIVSWFVKDLVQKEAANRQNSPEQVNR